MRLYFAYGSNMKLAQMEDRCPQSIKIGNVKLFGYRWFINTRAYANIIKSKGDYVEGVLFEISPTDEDSLDCWEGVHSGSYNKVVLKILHDNLEKEALVYIDPRTEEGKPSQEYIGRINTGIIDNNLSLEYVKKYIRLFVPE